ncbi:MAG: hypothetical protein A2W26_09065 [Acidobacteria bacterium RBG_16_64_8]|nr:MAG: hypothetical protein A2W26_09065 [Acidobacteria bacterium RBG_16_64_8]
MIRAALIVLTLFTLIYWLFDWPTLGATNEGGTIWGALLWALYVSAVSFVALGYGEWVHLHSVVARFAGVVEALIGVFLIALFAATFTRRQSP